MKGELTTVTKRLRRVFTFSESQVKEAALVNGATKIVINFANYIDWECFETSNQDDISPKVWEFVEKVEALTNLPVVLLGTGPRTNNVVEVQSRFAHIA